MSVTFPLEILLGAASLAILLPSAIYFLEVIFGLSNQKTSIAELGERLRVAVLIPAHNEAVMIQRTIRSIVHQLEPNDRLVVVADNCSDETADVAKLESAEVIVRHDLDRRGKGHALDFGVRHLENDSPDIVIIIDADCFVESGAIDRIARLCALKNRPIQSLYLMTAPEGAKLKMRIAEFAWLVKNRIRPTGLLKLGLPCQLMGTGMAFPWSSLRAVNLATNHIVEDLKLGLDLARCGSAPFFCPEAIVTSEFPISEAGAEGQRTRWEHGHLSVILQEAPRLFLASLKRRDGALMALASDLVVPPLALLSLVAVGLWTASTLLLVFAHALIPFVLSTTAAILIALSTLSAWRRVGRNIISLQEVGFAAIYAIYKIPIYMRFIWARQVDWVRSKREGDRS